MVILSIVVVCSNLRGFLFHFHCLQNDNYKNATSYHSKTISSDRCRMCIVEACFSSNDYPKSDLEIYKPSSKSHPTWENQDLSTPINHPTKENQDQSIKRSTWTNNQRWFFGKRTKETISQLIIWRVWRKQTLHQIIFF